MRLYNLLYSIGLHKDIIGEINRYTIFNGVLKHTITTHEHGILCLTCLSTGEIVSGDFDGMLTVWENKNKRQVIYAHKTYVQCVKTVGISFLVSAGGFENTIKVWRIEGKLVVEDSIYVYSNDFNIKYILPLSDTSFASSGGDNTIKIFKNLCGVPRQNLTGHTRCINCLVLLKDSTILSGSQDTTIKVWKKSWMGTYFLFRTLTDHNSGVKSMVDRGDYILSGDGHGKLLVWNKDFIKVNTIRGINQNINCITLLGNKVVIASYDSIYIISNIMCDSVNENNSITIIPNKRDNINCLLSLPNGELVSSDRSVKVWN